MKKMIIMAVTIVFGLAVASAQTEPAKKDGMKKEMKTEKKDDKTAKKEMKMAKKDAKKDAKATDNMKAK